MVKNDFKTKFHLVKQGTSKPTPSAMNNVQSLENMLLKVSDLFEEKEKITGKGKKIFRKRHFIF